MLFFIILVLVIAMAGYYAYKRVTNKGETVESKLRKEAEAKMKKHKKGSTQYTKAKECLRVLDEIQKK